MLYKKKIKLLYDARMLCCFLQKNKNRSGIMFVALNILREFAKNANIDITLFYEYQMYEEILMLKDQGIIPENCKLINLSDLTVPVLSKHLYFIYKLKNKYKRNDLNDNIFKKAIRFYAVRFFKLYNNFALYLSSFKSAAKDFDVYFTPYHKVPNIIRKIKNIKPYLIIHDIIPMVIKDFYKDYKSQIAGVKRIIESINYNDTYFTVSENTKKDILEYKKGIDPNHIIVAYLGANKSFTPNTENLTKTKLSYNIPENKKYVFSLCTLEPRKNLIFGIKNFIRFIKKNNITDTVFVLGGASWDKFSNIIKQNMNEFGDVSNLVIYAGYINDDDVATLYSGAEVFIYPSIYEGFGMPILEAMQCGCPVITSNVSSIPEVIGDAGIQIDPSSDKEMLEAYEKMYFDSDFREQCKTKGIERAKQFSWKKCADIMYNQMVKDFENENII